MLSIGQSSVLVDASLLKAGASAFRVPGWTQLDNVFDANLLPADLDELPDESFAENAHVGLKTELVAVTSPLAASLILAMNDPVVLDAISQITGAPISCFKGRVYRMYEGRHHDSWHDDLTEGNVAGLSINLSSVDFGGGHLRMRRKGTTEAVDVQTPPWNSGILFRLATDLEHRVTDVVGPAPKTALAGWFSTSEVFTGVLRRAATTASQAAAES